MFACCTSRVYDSVSPSERCTRVSISTILLVIGLKKYSPSGSDSEVILPKRVLTPRWPVSTTLTPQPATLTTMMAMTNDRRPT